jgi:hypothetical protein
MGDPLPGKPVDAADLKPCARCGKGVMHGGDVTFCEVTIAQCVVDLPNIRRIHGLEQMMAGNVALARVFSPDNTVARRLPATRHLFCKPCLLASDLAMLLEGSDA